LHPSTTAGNLNQVVGASAIVVGPGRAALWENGVGQDIGSGSALAINNLGWIVGNVGYSIPTIWINGQRIKIQASGSPLGINDLGQVVGGDGHWLWDNGKITSLPMYPFSINNESQIVGYEIGGPYGPAIWEGGQVHRLQDLLIDGKGWTLQDATHINDVGQIVG